MQAIAPALDTGAIPAARLGEAVTRILALKAALGPHRLRDEGFDVKLHAPEMEITRAEYDLVLYLFGEQTLLTRSRILLDRARPGDVLRRDAAHPARHSHGDDRIRRSLFPPQSAARWPRRRGMGGAPALEQRHGRGSSGPDPQAGRHRRVRPTGRGPGRA